MTDTAENRTSSPKRIRNIAELAAIAGVSAGTVSRALANKAVVNAKTRDRIQALAREHGFRVNQMASKLRRQETGVIAVVIPLGHDRRQHISDPFFMALLGALADELTERGFDLMLSRAIPQDDPAWLERIVSSGMVDGVLMIGQSDQFETIEEIAADYRPLVAWGSHREGQVHCSVGTDNRAGGQLAAEFLIGKGRSNLLFLGDTTGIEIEERYRGAAALVADHGLGDLRKLPVHLSMEEMSDELTAILAALEQGVDGIIAASDTIATVAIRLLHHRGIKVPDDVSVIGFDDLPLASHTVPQLTTIRQNIVGGAAEMVERLMQRLRGAEADALVMSPELIVRASA